MTASLEEILGAMQQHGVRFIVVSGWAAILHGSARSTSDVDLVYARDPVVTLERLIQLKRAAGRPKDLEAIAGLQALLDEPRNS